jgi:Ni,Fe-hydrogenase III large subunit
MPIRAWWERARPLPGPLPARGLAVDRERWLQLAREVAAAGGRLLALWADAPAVYAAYLHETGVLIAELTPGAADGSGSDYPGLEEIFPAASRMQRAAFEVGGLRSSDPDRRPWLRHAGAYDFVRVDGNGVHEIAVGPVHAGVIEPGHFRFSVVGEKVLRLEERLGYVHKGIEQRFTELPLLEGHRLAARVSGDSAVAFSWAYCQALESLSGSPVPPRGLWLRAAFLELERIANHLGDLGALGNDAGFAFGLMQFSRLKELLLRAQHSALGERYLLGAVVPGGSGRELTRPGARALLETVDTICAEAAELRGIYDEHAGVRDRFAGTGCLAPQLAARLGVIGLAGRASGQALDARVDFPCPPYDELAPSKIVHDGGDVAARVTVRFEELVESARLLGRILRELPAGPALAEPAVPAAGAFGVGLIEGWRGPVLVALEAGPGGSIRRCHPHDPSWQAWPALEHAILGNIVPDFPLINKSFNLSYSGVDL